MAIIVNFKIADVQNRLGLMQAKINNPNELLHGIGTLLSQSSVNRFESKTDPDGNRWADWKESTKRARFLKGNDSLGLLVDTTHLSNPANVLYEVNKNTVRIGSSLGYAVFHQEGTINMEARPIFGISREDEEDLKEEVQEWIAL